MITFEDLLILVSRQSPKGWLYLPKYTKWNLKSPATILESDEVPPELEDEPDAGVPEFAKVNHLQQVLEISTLQQIITNARTQKSDATLEDLFKAFEFYYKHDAFIELAGGE
jgi:hypothetical protein